MRKLIKVINSKIIHKKKDPDEKQINSEKFLNFNFRRQKLNTKVSLKSLPINTQSPNINLLAITNFEGTQFVVKSLTQSSIRIQQSNFSKLGEEKSHQHAESQLRIQISQEIENRFKFLISQINQIIRRLYFHKKKLLKQPPFQKNIFLVLSILVIFGIGLGAFTFFDQTQIESQGTNISSNYSFVLSGFVLCLILISLANVFYSIWQPYRFFNFDYEVMKRVTKKLMEQNEQFFKKKQFMLVCDIEVTWILLKPLNKDKDFTQSQPIESNKF